MIERFLKQTHFTSEQDFKEHLEFIIPEDFNFAYDVMDEWAKIKPDHVALLWTSERGEEIRFTYQDLKEQSDKAAAYFQSLGIGHDDKVMLILKRHYQWWLAMLGLHKLGAVAIPATHMLTKHDIIYRNNAASVKAIICCGDDYVVEQISEAMPESPTVKILISIGPDIPEGFHDWMKEWNECAPFVRPEHRRAKDRGTRSPLCARPFDHGCILAQPARKFHPSYRSRYRLGQGSLGQALRTMVCRSHRLRLRP